MMIMMIMIVICTLRHRLLRWVVRVLWENIALISVNLASIETKLGEALIEFYFSLFANWTIVRDICLHDIIAEYRL